MSDEPVRIPVAYRGAYYVRAKVGERWVNKCIPIAMREDEFSLIEFIPAWMGDDPDVKRFIENFGDYWRWQDGDDPGEAGWYGPVMVAIPAR